MVVQGIGKRFTALNVWWKKHGYVNQLPDKLVNTLKARLGSLEDELQSEIETLREAAADLDSVRSEVGRLKENVSLCDYKVADTVKLIRRARNRSHRLSGEIGGVRKNLHGSVSEIKAIQKALQDVYKNRCFFGDQLPRNLTARIEEVVKGCMPPKHDKPGRRDPKEKVRQELHRIVEEWKKLEERPDQTSDETIEKKNEWWERSKAILERELNPIAKVLQVGLKDKVNYIDRYFMALKACSLECRNPDNHWVGQQRAGPTSEARRKAGSDKHTDATPSKMRRR